MTVSLYTVAQLIIRLGEEEAPLLFRVSPKFHLLRTTTKPNKVSLSRINLLRRFLREKENLWVMLGDGEKKICPSD